MRAKRITQQSLFQLDYVDHPIGQALKAASAIIDAHPEWIELIAKDLGPSQYIAGRDGVSVDTVLRCLILKQFQQLSYRDLAFALRDSISFYRFARLTPDASAPSKTTLQALISQIRPGTWETMNAALIATARVDKVEPAQRVRIDSTVTETNILEPTDSSLLRDGVRVLVRLLGAAREHLGEQQVHFHNHARVAKRRERTIHAKRGNTRVGAYRDLIGYVRRTLDYVESAKSVVLGCEHSWADVWIVSAGHYVALIEQVIDQTERRVFGGEKVAASEKVLSLFEPHTDIIIKGGRKIQYGHKLNLSTGMSGLVLDAVVESGNPADSARLMPMLERHIATHGVTPRQVATDGGYASGENLTRAKHLGVQDVMFHKRKNIEIDAMTSTRRVYRELKRFRAGIEAGISYLKRCFGLSRCNWQGMTGFQAYVWSNVFTHNLIVLGRLRPT